MSNTSTIKKRSFQRIFVTGVFLALYIVLSLFSFLLLVDFTHEPQPVDITTLSDASRRGIVKEAGRLVMTVDEFIDRYVVTTNGIEVQINDALVVLVVLVTLFPLAYFFFTSIVLKHFDDSYELFSETELNMMRKRDLEKLRTKVETFFTQHQRYPNEEEYSYLVDELEGIIHDPKFDKPVQNREKELHGYRYDQYNPDSQKIDQQYYRLWSYLENGDRYFVTPDKEYTESHEGHF